MLAGVPAAASAASVVTVTSPQDGAVFYTGDQQTAEVFVRAELSSDCDGGNWAIRRNPPGGPYGPTITGGSIGQNPLQKTENLTPGAYEYSGVVDCADGSTYTTNFVQIRVIEGSADDAGPKLTLSGPKTQELAKRIAVRVKCDEKSTATATGNLSVPKTSKVYRLKEVSQAVEAGDKTTLKLKLSRAARKAARKALEDGADLTVKVKVVAEDAAGNKTTKRRAIDLKLP